MITYYVCYCKETFKNSKVSLLKIKTDFKISRGTLQSLEYAGICHESVTTTTNEP